MKVCLLFPGQGSQKVGMGESLWQAFAEAKKTFEEASDCLGQDMVKLCFKGPQETLTLTANAQPAIMTVSIAALRSLAARVALQPSLAMGHSLGEWSAWVAAGALDFADALRLVRLRGQAMQRSMPEGQGAMAAVLGLPADVIEDVCREAAGDEVCQPANYNGGEQIVISGHAGAVERASTKLKQAGAKRVVPLPVSAPFHCPLMSGAAREVEEALREVSISRPDYPVAVNVTGDLVEDPDKVAKLLVEQVTGAVRWDLCAAQLGKQGIAKAFECGHGQTLAGLQRRIDRKVEVSSVANDLDIEKLQEELS